MEQQELDIVTGFIYDIQDNLDLLNMLLKLKDTKYYDKYSDYIDEADNYLNKLLDKVKNSDSTDNNDPEANDPKYSITVTEGKLTDKRLKSLILDINDYNNGGE